MYRVPPHLRKYSTTSFQSQVLNSNGSLALVGREDTNGGYSDASVVRPFHLFSHRAPDAHKFQGGRDTPRDLIQHETFSSLINEVHQLRRRCDSLEEANAELKRDLLAAHDAQSAGVHTVAEFKFSDRRTNLNLTGYASSDGSTSSHTAVFGKHRQV